MPDKRADDAVAAGEVEHVRRFEPAFAQQFFQHAAKDGYRVGVVAVAQRFLHPVIRPAIGLIVGVVKQRYEIRSTFGKVNRHQ
ncbi:hypothetical protein ACSQ76_18825 [Roseovarius sp. B08]|uniref:hypothetical protein n=1 Tax=Roseovarius sp. B08 TaxID=3449223 RepID=UPI003EDC819B